MLRVQCWLYPPGVNLVISDPVLFNSEFIQFLKHYYRIIALNNPRFGFNVLLRS